MSILKYIAPLMLALVVLPANATSADKIDDLLLDIDDLLLDRSTPLWSPVAYSGPYGPGPSCYFGDCSPTGMTCDPSSCSNEDYSNCTNQGGVCAPGCAGATPNVPDSGNCYPRY